MRTVLDEIGFNKEKIVCLMNYCVCGVDGGYLEEGDQYIKMTFHNPDTKKYVELEFDSDGLVYITDPYEAQEGD